MDVCEEDDEVDELDDTGAGEPHISLHRGQIWKSVSGNEAIGEGEGGEKGQPHRPHAASKGAAATTARTEPSASGEPREVASIRAGGERLLVELLPVEGGSPMPFP